MHAIYREKIDNSKKALKWNFPQINQDDIESFIWEIIWPRIDDFEMEIRNIGKDSEKDKFNRANAVLISLNKDLAWFLNEYDP